MCLWVMWHIYANYRPRLSSSLGNKRLSGGVFLLQIDVLYDMHALCGCGCGPTSYLFIYFPLKIINKKSYFFITKKLKNNLNYILH